MYAGKFEREERKNVKLMGEKRKKGKGGGTQEKRRWKKETRTEAASEYFEGGKA